MNESNQPSSRQLTDTEKETLLKLLTVSFQGRDELIEQISDCIATPTGDPDNYGSIYLKTNSPAKAPTASNVPVEGLARDKDGAEIVVLLHISEGFVSELEVIRSDGKPLLSQIDPKTIIVALN